MLSDKTYAELLLIDSAQYNDLENVAFVGALFDHSADLQDIRGTEKGQEIASEIKPENLMPADQARFHYYQANGWSNIRHHRRFEQQTGWDYDQEELTQEIFHLRSCLRSDAFGQLEKELQCQAYTNLGNHFSHVGRFVEAQQMWHSALKIIEYFPMALGNIGQGYFYYGRAIYDEAHRNILIYHAYRYINKALSLKRYLHPGAYEHWKSLKKFIDQTWPENYLQAEHDFDDFDLGKARPLRCYRRWCLELQLYINPLNDLAAYNIACHDVLQLPVMTVKVGDAPKYHTLFNQIKQEYATARFLFYEGTQPHKPHYADKDIRLVDTLEYAEYSYHLEKVKIAFRLIYSLFDKIGYLLNDYLQIGLKRKDISFKALWHENIKGKKTLRSRFQNNNNLALRGLYWLSKDLFNVDDEDAHGLVLEPDAQELANIRDHIEHKSFKVVQYGTWGGDDPGGYTFSIDRGKFELKTLKLMRLVRSAIIYTSLAIHHEEQLHSKGPSFPIDLPEMPFDDKV